MLPLGDTFVPSPLRNVVVLLSGTKISGVTGGEATPEEAQVRTLSMLGDDDARQLLEAPMWGEDICRLTLSSKTWKLRSCSQGT